MNLPRLLRTSTFRLTLLYAGLTCLSFLSLFVIVFWSTTKFMQHQIDSAVNAEIDEVHTAAMDGGLDALSDTLRTSIKQSAGFYYLLEDGAGNVLAGNLPRFEPRVGVRQWIGPIDSPEHPTVDIRGRGEVVSKGAYLFVGANAHQVHEMRESVARSFLLGLGVAMLLALTGGAAMSLSVLRRIEAISQTSREIVGGDLQRRIPLNGSGDEFDHLSSSVNAMLDRIQVLMDGLRQVSTDIAHDLRTPLTHLRQRLELAQKRPPDAAALSATLSATLVNVDAILQTFGALLRIAQVESGTRKESFSRVDLSDILQTVAEVYQPAFEEKSQQFDAFIAPGLLIDGDRELLTQLFANLVENAVRHCSAGAKISLTAAWKHDGVDVSVSDNGPGIPAAMHEKVLQRFVRLDASRSTPGNGLGLSMVAAIIGLHDASWHMADNGPGLRFTVSLRSSPIA